ncbi:MAG: ABC transporter ATP-binding protein [Candidatus Tectomicrobia bacterium]|nr:ABC transporter ATP-binding protein [Candidatus Tectomicrobia bacterium]
MLELEGVAVSYGEVHAVRGVSLRLEAGRIACLIGRNGAGKSTILMAISGIVPAAAGRILFEGKQIDGLSPAAIVRRGVSQVPEGRRVFPLLTVQENLELGAFTRRDRGGIAADLEAAYAAFPILAERRKQAAGTLSGGEQQMLAISRALMARPKLLLLDEPSLGLAPRIVEQIFEALAAINGQGTTLFLIEQNAQMALELAHSGYVLENGVVVLSGASKELRTDDRVRRAYLGET